MSDSAKSWLGFTAIAAVFALAVFAHQPGASSPLSPQPLVATKLDLRPAFEANPNVAQRREHAQALAAVLAIVIDGVEFDGRQEPAERIFTRGATVDDNIVRVRTFYTQRWSFAPQYPKLGETIGAYLKDRLGKDLTDSLTDQRRSEWIQALREVQASALKI